MVQSPGSPPSSPGDGSPPDDPRSPSGGGFINPLKYRPENLPYHMMDKDDPLDWEDNKLSNFMAWVSQTYFLESMCNTETHWSSRVSNYLWTSCPCCLTWRGLVLGVLFGLVVGLTAGMILGFSLD